MTEQYENLWTVEDLAEYLRGTKDGIYSLIRAGKLPEADVKLSRKFHRWTPAKVRQFIEGGSEEQPYDPPAEDDDTGVYKKPVNKQKGK